ncbi:LIM domain-containing protein 1-like isoform X2 [Tigriopus californicus]|uniref:LIM domain-containing protein 1-like isoform X2 n=1 Tax=Tigriopus californicus TaxID=6832 RepID=UPI0027DA6DC4|nr:LIM domain-containing protein 1-like isoform X2 [Tigriopus californicus]
MTTSSSTSFPLSNLVSVQCDLWPINECESDDLTIPSFNSFRRRLDSTTSQDSYCSSPIPCPVTEAVTSAEISPQRTSVASIQLCPSPLVQRRRNQSQSPQRRMNRVAHPSSYHSTNGISISSTARRNPTSAVPSNVRPTRPTTQRSISVQSSVRGRDTSQNGPRKPPAISATGTNGSTRALNGSTRTLNGSNRNLNGSTKSISGSTRSINGSARPLNGSSRNLAASNRNLAPPRPAMNRSVSADPRLDDPEIQAKLGNRATKVVQKSLGACGVCGKAINEDGCTAFGKFYHKTCFKCTVCRQKITGKFFEKNGKPYCAKDFQQLQESCTVCKLPIKGDSVVSNDKPFHPECMKCFICGDSLRGQFLTFQDKPICERDYKQNADKCSICGEVPMGKFFSADGEIRCEKCHDDECEKCLKCREPVVGKVITINCGSSYHPDCFSCQVCKKTLVNLPFVSDDKHQIYCPEDWNKKKAAKCAFCKKAIVPKNGQKTASRLRAMGKDYHPECFQCEDCNLVLDSKDRFRQCYPYKNHVLCYKCNRKKLSSSESECDDDDDEE